MSTQDSDSSQDRPDEGRRSGPPYLGPVTQAAIVRVRQGEPPPLVKEWCEHLRKPGDFVLYWAGATRGHRGPDHDLGWGFLTTSLSDDEDDEEAPAGEGALPGTCDPTAPVRTERLLSPLAHESRIRMMQALYEGARSSSELAEATGLRGGNLYYHLKELVRAGYVREDEGAYLLTALGRQLLITFTTIALYVVKDSEDEGLIVDGDW